MASPFADYPAVLRHLETRLLVADLKDLLKDLHLSTSGNKRPLIDRVAAHLNLLRSSNDVTRYNALKNKILQNGGSPSYYSTPPSIGIKTTFSNSPQNGNVAGSPYNSFAGNKQYGVHNRPVAAIPVRAQQVLNFRPSPFYEVVERISAVATLPYASRNTVSLTFVCSMTALDKIQESNTSHRVALMCGESTFAYNPNRQLLMEFPNPAEVRVNNQKISGNLRGMKNKPGTIPPPDITQYVSKTPRLPNRVEITYTCGADVNKKFGAQVVLLRTHTVPELVERVKNGVRFHKDRVLEKLRKPNDDDIEMASFDLTLRDPLSYTRISVPCRSLSCKHNQCFDAAAFLSINEQTPQWSCPICHVEISSLSSIAVDGYFQDILDNVSSEVDTILVDPQGNWKLPSDEAVPKQAKQPARDEDHAYEVLDLDDTEDEDATAIKDKPRGSTPIVTNVQNKRKVVPICIDLTEDSDDDSSSSKRIKSSHSMDNSAQLPAFSPKTVSQNVPQQAVDMAEEYQVVPTSTEDEQIPNADAVDVLGSADVTSSAVRDPTSMQLTKAGMSESHSDPIAPLDQSHSRDDTPYDAPFSWEQSPISPEREPNDEAVGQHDRAIQSASDPDERDQQLLGPEHTSAAILPATTEATRSTNVPHAVRGTMPVNGQSDGNHHTSERIDETATGHAAVETPLVEQVDTATSSAQAPLDQRSAYSSPSDFHYNNDFSDPSNHNYSDEEYY